MASTPEPVPTSMTVRSVDARTAAARRGTGAWWRGGRCRTPSTAGWRPTIGASHGGATMMLPTRTAAGWPASARPSPRRARRAAVERRCGELAARCAAARGRGPALVRKKTRHDPPGALSSMASTSRSVSVAWSRSPCTARARRRRRRARPATSSAGQVRHALAEDVLDAVEQALVVFVVLDRRRLELLLAAARWPAARAASAAPS